MIREKIRHTVRQGECLSSIAYDYGFTIESLLNFPENREIKERRDSNVLNPGDIIVVPDKSIQQYSATTGSKHRFVRKNEPELVRIEFLEYGEPRSNENYHMLIDGEHRVGVLDSDGVMAERISPDAKELKVSFGDGDEEELVEFALGALDPVDTTSGVQARLLNLGFHCGLIDGVMGPRTRGALHDFQLDHKLKETGEPDETTQSSLVEAHRC